MSDPSSPPPLSGSPRGPERASQHGALGTYLRSIAGALAVPNATADAVLAVADARDVRRDPDHAYFRPPDPRFIQAAMKLTGVADVGTSPGTVTFDADLTRPPVTLSEVVAAFGAWAPGLRPTSRVRTWRVEFVSRYRRPGAAEPGAASVAVNADLSGDPAASDTRVLRITLRRDAFGLE